MSRFGEELRPESAKRIIDAYYDVFDQLSIKNFNQGIGFVLQNLEERVRSLRPIKTRDAFLARLLKEPEPEPLELDAQVEMVYMLPSTLRKVMPQAMRETMRALPQDPGGRPNALTEEQSRSVCEEIGILFARGVHLIDAQKRLCHRMGVSLRTIQRAWQGRAKWFRAADDPEDDHANGKAK